jgi:hypothetical protein
MMTKRPFLRYTAATLSGLFAWGIAFTTSADHRPNHEPANKVAVTASTDVVFGPGTEVTLLEEQIRTASRTDLILSVSLRCLILVRTTQSPPADMSHVLAVATVWVEVDGVPVPVSTHDDGRVPFCDQSRLITTTDLDEVNATSRTLGGAHAFNWMRLDAGQGVHTITVKAELLDTEGVADNARAVIGQRTLIIEPVKLARGDVPTVGGQ